MAKNIDRVYIISNGQQAPYGIGEIIDIIPLSHWRKIYKEMSRYYNAPNMRLNGKQGKWLDWEYYYDEIIGITTVQSYR